MVRCRDVTLSRPVRLLHPRFPLYIVPRGEHLFMVGATMIESDERGRVTARSLVELLNAAYALHPAFAEAEIVEIGCDARPAFPDNLPRIRRQRPTRCSSTASTATASCWRRRWRAGPPDVRAGRRPTFTEVMDEDHRQQ